MQQSTTTLHMGQRLRSWAPRIFNERLPTHNAPFNSPTQTGRTWTLALAWASGTTFYAGMRPVPVTIKRSRSASKGAQS